MKCRGKSDTTSYHGIFRVVSHVHRYISCYIAESRLPLGQCRLAVSVRLQLLWSVLMVARLTKQLGEGLSCECEVAAALVCVDGGQVDKTAGGGAKL